MQNMLSQYPSRLRRPSNTNVPGMSSYSRTKRIVRRDSDRRTYGVRRCEHMVSDTMCSMSDEVSPFTIDVPESVRDDLRVRLQHTRWPDRENVDDWSQG